MHCNGCSTLTTLYNNSCVKTGSTTTDGELEAAPGRLASTNCHLSSKCEFLDLREDGTQPPRLATLTHTDQDHAEKVLASMQASWAITKKECFH